MSFSVSEDRAKLLAEPTELDQPFWDGLAEGKLRIQHCSIDTCGNYQYPFETFCFRCGSDDIGWDDASGEGEIHTFVTVHQRYHAAFADILPYNVSVIELDEGTRIVSNVINIDTDDVKIGMRVKVAPQPAGDGRYALFFEKA